MNLEIDNITTIIKLAKEQVVAGIVNEAFVSAEKELGNFVENHLDRDIITDDWHEYLNIAQVNQQIIDNCEILFSGTKSHLTLPSNHDPISGDTPLSHSRPRILEYDWPRIWNWLAVFASLITVILGFAFGPSSLSCTVFGVATFASIAFAFLAKSKEKKKMAHATKLYLQLSDAIHYCKLDYRKLVGDWYSEAVESMECTFYQNDATEKQTGTIFSQLTNWEIKNATHKSISAFRQSCDMLSFTITTQNKLKKAQRELQEKLSEAEDIRKEIGAETLRIITKYNNYLGIEESEMSDIAGKGNCQPLAKGIVTYLSLNSLGLGVAKTTAGLIKNVGTETVQIAKGSSKLPQAIANVGRAVGRDIRTVRAINTASKIGRYGRFLGFAGAIAGIFLQFWTDRQDKKIAIILASSRHELRNKIAEVVDSLVV